MSDTSQGDGWWLASDGKWYPPESNAAAAPPPPPPPPTVAPPAAPSLPPPPPPVAPGSPVPPAGPTPTPESPLWKRPWFIVIAVLVIGLLVASVLNRDDDPDEVDGASTDGIDLDLDLDLGGDTDLGDLGDLPDQPSASEGSESADFIRCTMVAEDGLELEVVNNSSETSNYFITIVFRDADGTRLADELQTVNNLRPGERTIESTFSFDRTGTSCEAGDVDRFSSQSAADELDDANGCELTGRDSFDDLTAATSVTNNSSETSDYFLTVAFVRADGVRVGTGTASASAVAPGETAPTDVFTFVEADASRCDVVAVQRFASD